MDKAKDYEHKDKADFFTSSNDHPEKVSLFCCIFFIPFGRSDYYFISHSI